MEKRLLNKVEFFLKSNSILDVLPLTIVIVGILLRLIQYFINRSLWIDEAFLALNIINKSWLELLNPLDYNQAAPVGFLLIEKLITQIFGASEYSLRLFPLISGIISLLLFYQVARWLLKTQTVPIALGLFAISDRLIYFSSEVKQYSIDVAITLLLYLAIINLLSKKLAVLPTICLGILGAIAVWISHSAVFVLAGTGLSLILFALHKKEWSKVIKYLVSSAIWVLSFLIFYFVSLRELSNNEYLVNSWNAAHNAFMPLPPTSLSNISWFINTFFEIFNYPLGLLSGIAALSFIVGCIHMFRYNKENFTIIVSPILIALLASGLHKYPFEGHLLLFTVPMFLLIIAVGTQTIIDRTKRQNAAIGTTLALLLFFHPVYNSALNLRKPQNSLHPFQRIREDIKPVLEYVEARKKPGDIVYLYYASQYAFKYYAGLYNFDYTTGQAVWNEPPKTWFEPALPSYLPHLIVGRYFREDRNILTEDINKLRGNKRVWLIFSHVSDRRSSISEEDLFVDRLDRLGDKLDSFQGLEASAYLYHLSSTT